MRIALIGYGKMGKAIEHLAIERGHEVCSRIDLNNHDQISLIKPATCDVAIEFSQPQTALLNVSTCLRNGIKVLSGTTGWMDRLGDVEKLTRELNGTFLYASNFSPGVNVFFDLNEFLASKMQNQNQFEVSMKEVHHTEKLDSPSGTAISLANGIMKSNSSKKGWTNDKTTGQTKIGIISNREPNVAGTHTVQYSSELETIEIKHTAHDRNVFASGALDVAEWMQNQSGVLTFNDYLTNTK
ncbi:MAG: 4-hydroxy-tetrahydrodipicolinate reductase [Cytophagales bacterium]|nr:4-hydroxy-tetrahydrodipicolinate reductase [Cytophagales bacterium]